MPVVATTVGLLILSNVFMTFAWYAHVREMNDRPWWIAALHTHVIPRDCDEPAALRTANPCAYDWKAAPDFDAAALALRRQRIADALTRGAI